ncbi:hypothetical protein OR1_03387 [Geobacter sp. OR-1]|uniref:DUF7092 domain-containing protein n=1 Tax=Geobacter sp. OR-1 TaxID=1266765 RepID=UPI000542D59C|nr:hypothetical protein [Geobacter sp. OR-1]GAM11078.1 hypothetical protein OR1_03387 [Geobacter sp. OR-1]
MKPLRGYYFDGRSSARRTVVLERAGDLLLVRGDGLDLSFPAGSVKLAPKVGAGRSAIRFPNGALCELATDEPLEQLLGVGGG